MKLRYGLFFSLVCVFCAGSLYAAKPGPYVGGGAGYSSLNDFSDATKKNNGGTGGNIFVGYNFNPFLGIEASYRIYADTSYTLDNYPAVTFDYTMRAMTLVGKAYVPLDDTSPFNLYALLGFANVYGKGNIQSPQYYENVSSSNRAILATAGFGLSYDITAQVNAGFEYSFTQGNNGDDNSIGIPQSSLATINLSYHFG